MNFAMKTAFITLVFCLNIALGSAFAAAQADSQQQAVSIAQQQYPGRVLSVKQKKDHYKIKILDKTGNLRVIRVDKSRGNGARYKGNEHNGNNAGNRGPGRQ